MQKIIEKLRAGLVVSVITLGCVGLISESALAGEDKEKEVRVNCDKGESVQDVLDLNITNSKPLVLIIQGTCDEELDEGFVVERDNVIFEGDEDVGGVLAKPLFVQEAKKVQIDDGMTLHSLYVNSGEFSIEAGGDVTIEYDVFLSRKSLMTIATSSDDEEGTGGSVTIGGPITIEGHSLLSVESGVAEGEESEGEVVLGSLFARLQSSVDLNHATVGDIIVLEFDSQALLGEGLASNSVYGVTQVSCDMQSRAWNQSPIDFNFNPVWGTMIGELCKTDPPPPPPGP